MVRILFLLLFFLSIAAPAAEDSQPATENSLTAGNSFDLRLDFSVSDTEAVTVNPDHTGNNKSEPKDNHRVALNVPEEFTEVIDRIYCCTDINRIHQLYYYSYYDMPGSSGNPVDDQFKGVFEGISAEEVVAMIDWLEQNPDQGDPNGQFFLGWIYENGVGVHAESGAVYIFFMKWENDGSLIPADQTRAAYWYYKLAEQGYAEAQYRFGYLSKNAASAAYWHHKAADQGHYEAMRSVAVAYEEGDGVPVDFSRAVDWYRTVAEAGDKDIAYELGMMYANGKQVARDDAEAIYWLEQTIDECGGVTHSASYEAESSFFQLGLLYANSEGSAQDQAQAVDYFRKAAVRDHTGGRYHLGLAYYKGEGVLKDYIEAYAWLSLATGEDTLLDEITAKLTDDELQQAQALAEEHRQESPQGDGFC